jgi:allantoinase
MKGRERGDWMAAWGGVASLELGLPVMWTEARRRGASLEDLARWMSAGPAELCGLGDRIGRIAGGCDADLVAFDPDAAWVIDAARLRQRHKLTPYAGRRVEGRVARVWRRGVEQPLGD